MFYPYVDIHTHAVRVSPGVISIYSVRYGVDMPSGVTASCWVGVHPWDASLGFALPPNLEMVGVGEIGLDFLRPHKEHQIEAFMAQLNIAKKRGLPVLLHVVRAHEEVLAILKQVGLQRPFIVHGFIGSVALAERYLNMGGYLSFGVQALKSAKTVDAMAKIDLNRVFLETDNSQISIEECYGLLLPIFKCGPEHLREVIFDNYNRFFCL